MIGSCRGTPTRAFLPFALLVCSSTAFGDTTYKFSSVSSGFGNELIPVFGAPGGSGTALSDITTINLPVALSSRTTFYDINSVFQPNPFSFTQQWSGRWQMSNSNGDGLYGTFSSSSSTNYDFTKSFGTFTVFNGYAGTLVVGGGTGFYSGASGGGSFESYLNYTQGLPNGGSEFRSLNVDRLQVTLPYDTGVPQTDTRGVSVLMLTGTENSLTEVGHNEGPILSSEGSLQPLTHEVNDYTLNWPEGPPFVGHFLDTNASGDSLEGTFYAPIGYPGRSGFGYGRGTGTFIGGTGAYADMGGGSEYEAFSLGLGTEDGVNYDYMVITASRSQLVPVPEPESWALLLVGFGVLGAYQARKARRSSAV